MNDIELLFAKDPLNLSDKDIETIIEHLRIKRKTFENKPKKITPKPKPTDNSPDFDTLGIEL